MTVTRVAFECAERIEKSTLGRSRLNRQHSVEQVGDACRAGAWNELVGKAVEHAEAMVIKQTRQPLIRRRG